MTTSVRGVRQRRPSGTYRATTLNWQNRVKDELATLGWEQQDLAKAIQCSPVGITGVLKVGARQSRLVDAINAVLKIAPPEYMDDTDARDHRTIQDLRRRDPGAHARVMDLARRELQRAPDAKGSDPDVGCQRLAALMERNPRLGGLAIAFIDREHESLVK